MLFATLADHNEEQKLVFVNSIDMLKKLYRMLQMSNRRVFSLHSGKSQKERFAVVEKFKKIKGAVLIGKYYSSLSKKYF